MIVNVYAGSPRPWNYGGNRGIYATVDVVGRATRILVVSEQNRRWRSDLQFSYRTAANLRYNDGINSFHSDFGPQWQVGSLVTVYVYSGDRLLGTRRTRIQLVRG